MLIDIISTTLRVVVCCIVFAYCLFTPFKSRFRYNNLVTAVLAGLLTAITVVVIVLFLTSGKFLVKYSSFGIDRCAHCVYPAALDFDGAAV